jgi:hypothetical protein
MNYKKEAIYSQKGLSTLKITHREIITKAKRGPSKPTRIPSTINEELGFLIAAIIGDGHLKKEKFQINFDSLEKNNAKFCQKVCIDIFKRKFNISKRFEKGKLRYCLIMDSKAIYNLFNKTFKIPFGKKSNNVTVPAHIKLTNISVKSAFIIGILITEGGKRRRGFGLSTASKKLWIGLDKIFLDIGIEIKKDKWVNKKYNKEYYGLVFKKNQLERIINLCHNKYIRSIMIHCKNFVD